jgi:hypothetical protein
MRKIQLLILPIICGVHSFTVSAQTATVKVQKAIKVWVYTKQGSLQKGIWDGSSDTSLSIYRGRVNEYLNQKRHELASINYETISIIKVKKHGGLLKGLLIGAGIGLAPIVFGQGGAFVAFISFPVGIITGTIVGITSKKKYIINGDLHAFQKFINKRL